MGCPPSDEQSYANRERKGNAAFERKRFALQPSGEEASQILKEDSLRLQKRAAEGGRRLFIGNLAYATTEAQLKAFFSGYEVVYVSIPVKRRANQQTGHAFVELNTAEAATNAISELDDKEILESRVSVPRVRKSKPAGEKNAATDVMSR